MVRRCRSARWARRGCWHRRPRYIEGPGEGRENQVGPRAVGRRCRIVRGVQGGRDALDRDGRLQVVVDAEDHAAGDAG